MAPRVVELVVFELVIDGRAASCRGRRARELFAQCLKIGPAG